MTKSEKREIAIIIKMQHFGANYVARALSNLIRSARTAKSHNEIMAIALDLGVTDNPEFIV
jgi:cobalamin biosynthesis protein CbiG